MRKLFALIIAGIMACNLVGCGQTSTTSSTATKEADGKKTKITAWAWGPNVNIAALNIAKPLYAAKNPDVELEILEIANEDVVQKLNAALGSGSTKGLPNIVLIEDYRAQNFIDSYPDAFVEMQNVINYDDFIPYKQFLKGANGEQYGIPFDIGPAVIYYRKDLIEQAGYTEQDMQNLTWEQYIQIGKDLKEKTGTYLMAIDPNDLVLIRTILQSTGQWYVKEDGKTPNFTNNPVLKQAIALYTELVTSDNVKVVSEWAQIVGAPNAGEVATVMQGSWFTGNIMNEPSQSGLWRVAPFPQLTNAPGETKYSNSGGSSWYVLNGVEGQDVAVDFLKQTFGSSEDFYVDLMNERGVMGSYIPVQSNEVFQQEVEYFGGQKIYSDFNEWALKIPQVEYGKNTFILEDILIVELQNIIAGTDIDQAIARAQAQAETQVK